MNLPDWSRADILSVLSLAISSVALMVSVLAACGTLWQAWTAHRAHEREIKNVEPVIEWKPMRPMDEWEGWFNLRLMITNRSAREINVDRIQFASNRFKILSVYDSYIHAGIMKRLDSPPMATNEANIDTLIASTEYIQRGIHDYSSRQPVELLVTWVERSAVSKLSVALRKSPETARMFITISFKDEKTKKKTIPIAIEIPPKSMKVPVVTKT